MRLQLSPVVSLQALDALLVSWILLISEIRKKRRASAGITGVMGMCRNGWAPRAPSSLPAWPCTWVRRNLIASLTPRLHNEDALPEGHRAVPLPGFTHQS